MFLLGQIDKFVTESKVQGEQRNAETNNSSASQDIQKDIIFTQPESVLETSPR